MGSRSTQAFYTDAVSQRQRKKKRKGRSVGMERQEKPLKVK